MALDAPLNHRQVDVLRWINDGCPAGRWTDISFKAVAVALQSRRLVSISKRGGVWTATILPAGVHYLTHGQYPPGHWRIKRTPNPSDEPDAAGAKPVPISKVAPKLPRPPSSNPPDGLTPTRKLLKDIIDAGGILERDTREDDTSYRSLVGIINRRKMGPDGQEVIMLSGATYHQVIFRLSSVSDWKTEPPTEVVAAERVTRWHPLVAALRKEKRLSSIDKSLRERAFRLLHALAREAQSRGHSVRLPKRNFHGYVDDPSQLAGDLIIQVKDIQCSLNLWQPKDRVPHTATPDELARARRDTWYRAPAHDYVTADRLSITLDTDSRYSTKVTWSDTKTLSLELRLPDVMTTFERWAVIDAERKDAERRAAIEAQKRREREDELARQAYTQHALAGSLINELDAWELVGRLRRYLTEMAARIEHITNDDERATAIEWMEWCQRLATERDPFNGPIGTPRIKPPGYSEVAAFRKRLGFGSGFW